ncbi:MAG: hypothetical protein AAF581_19595 [Planctomycetota bacterium]
MTRAGITAATQILLVVGVCTFAVAQRSSRKIVARQEGSSERQVLVVDVSYNLKAERNGIQGGGHRSWKVRSTRTVTFDAVKKSGRVTKVGISYGEVTEKSVDAKAAKTLPVSGKSYRAQIKNGGKAVRSADGKPVPVAELSRVTADLQELGTITPLQRLLWEKRKHSRFTAGHTAAATFFGFSGDKRLQIRQIEWTAAPSRTIAGQRQLVFETRVQVSTLQDGFVMPVELNGKLACTADSCLPVSWELSGDLLFETAGTVAGAQIEARATGRVSLRREHTTTPATRQ